MKELKAFLRGRFFSATFSTKEKKSRRGVFQMLGWNEKSKTVLVRDMALMELRSFRIENLKEIRCGEFKFEKSQS